MLIAGHDDFRSTSESNACEVIVAWIPCHTSHHFLGESFGDV